MTKKQKKQFANISQRNRFDNLEVGLVDRFVLEPAENDLHHVVPVGLVLQQLAAHPLLQPRDELEDEVLRLHLETRQSVRLLLFNIVHNFHFAFSRMIFGLTRLVAWS